MKKKIIYISLMLLITFTCVGCSKEEKTAQSTEKAEQNSENNSEKNTEETSKEKETTEKKVTADDVEALIKKAMDEGLTDDAITEIDSMYSKLNAAEKEEVSSYAKYQSSLIKYKVDNYTNKITSCVDNTTGFKYSVDEFDDTISITSTNGHTSQTVSSDGYMFIQTPAISVSFSDNGEPKVSFILFWTYASNSFLDAYALSNEELILLGEDSSRVNLTLKYMDSNYDDVNTTDFVIYIDDTNISSIIEVLNSGTVVARLNAANNNGVLPQATLDDACKTEIVNAIKLYESISAAVKE